MPPRLNVFGQLVCAVVICTCVIACQTPSSRETWLILKRTSHQNPEIVSVLEKLPSVEIRRQFPVLLEVAWGYKGLPNGLPTEDEIIFGRTLYAELDRIVGAHGMHAMTRTGDGGRTMYYYVDDPAPLQDAIREFFDAQPPISVKVTTRTDSNWKDVENVLNAIRDGAQPSVAADAPQAARR